MARTTPDLTPDRAQRLCKMLRVLGAGPQPKEVLVKKLNVEERGFFRDLKLIRQLGITISSARNRYLLSSSLDDAISRLPIPDLKLSLRDVLELSQGQSPTHRRVRRRLEAILGPIGDFEKRPASHRVHLGPGARS